MLKGQPPNFKASVWNFPIPATGSKCNSIFRHAENWTEKKDRILLGKYILSQFVIQGVQKFNLNLEWGRIL